MYKDSQHAPPAENLPFLSPFSPEKWKQTDLRKHIQRGKRERERCLLLEPHQCSSGAGTSVPVCPHCGTWSYLCCQHFSRDISSLRTAWSYFHQNQGQIASDLKESRNTNSFCGGDPSLRLLCWKNPPHLYARDSKKQIPVLSLFSPQSDMKHHVTPTKNRSETSQHGLVPQTLTSLLHCPSTALLLGIPNATVDHELLIACSTRDFLTLPVFLVLKYSLFITLLSDYITDKMLHMEIVLPNFCIKHDIPATHSEALSFWSVNI